MGVRIRTVGTDLGRATDRVFRHLAAPAADRRALRIDLWDEAVTRVSPPDDQAPDEGDAVVRIGTAEVTTHGGGRCLSFRRGPESTTLLDREQATIVGWRRDASRMPFVEYSKPFSLLLRTWYYDRDVDFVHAALVAKRGSGILLGGHSGAGKSTAALACLAAGFDCIGDDEVGLQSLEDSFVGHSLYNSTRVRGGSQAQVDRLRKTAPGRLDSESGKSLYFLSELVSRPSGTRASIRAAAFPRIVDSRSCGFEPIPAREALFRLGATAVFGPLGFGQRAYARMKRLFASLPCYELQLGRDWSEVPVCFDRILAEVEPR